MSKPKNSLEKQLEIDRRVWGEPMHCLNFLLGGVWVQERFWQRDQARARIEELKLNGAHDFRYVDLKTR